MPASTVHRRQLSCVQHALASSALALFLVACSSDGAGPSAGASGGPGATAGASASGGRSAVAGASNGGASGNAAGGTLGSAGLGPTGGQANVGGSNPGTGGQGSAGIGAGGAAGAAGAAGAPTKGYFVSPTGSDDASGTLSAPFKTLSKARDVVRTVNSSMTDDVHVYLRGGIYDVAGTIAFGPQDSGTNGHTVYYEGYPGETPVLNGATRVTGWTLHSGNIYKASLNRKTKLRNLYVNDTRALMASKTVAAQGGYGTYSVTAGQASWAWASGSNSDGVKYLAADVPNITSNKDDLEIVNGTTWNENIVCVRDVITTTDNNRALLLQQPYGAIAQLPNWNSGFSATGSHRIFNALELLNAPGQFYFDKTAGVLYYYPRSGEDLATADVEAPVVEKLIDIAGTSKTTRVSHIAFQGLTFQNTDYNLYAVADSRGKATVQGATVYVAYGDGNWHNSKYEITDTLPGMITVNSADSITLANNVIKHGGSEGVSLINDVINSNVVGNYITDIAGSGITVGHPQHVYVGDGGTHAKYSKDVEGICTKNKIDNNVLYDVSSLPGFGGHAGITAFFVDSLTITHNHIQKTAYNGINLGWGWRNFTDSTTCKNNSVNSNRLIDTLNRLHDSGAVYTLGQMSGTTINQNYVKGIPPATSGPTYGLHNDEGSAFITENDNVLDIDPNVKYTINCEDYGGKHDLTIRRTYATVNKMGANPPMSTIDPPVAVADNVWAAAQYDTCLASGIDDSHRTLLPASLLPLPDYLFPASRAASLGTDKSLAIRSSGNAANTVWLAAAGTTQFAEGATATKAAGDSLSIAIPASAGSYRLHLVDATGKKLGESKALLRVK